MNLLHESSVVEDQLGVANIDPRRWRVVETGFNLFKVASVGSMK